MSSVPRRMIRLQLARSCVNRPLTTSIRFIFAKLGMETPLAIQRLLPRVGPVVVTLPNDKPVVLSVGSPEFYSNRLFWGGMKAIEPEVMPVWCAVLEQSDLVVDIGAHIGLFSLAAGVTNPRARIVAFEPHPDMARILRENVAANALGRVEVVEKAVSSSSGAATLLAVPQALPSSSSLDAEFMSDQDLLESIAVARTTLDESLCLDAEAIRLCTIKIDVEGHELEVLRGARHLIAKLQPVIFVEMLPGVKRPPTLDGLSDTDYIAFALTEEGTSPLPTIMSESSWPNRLLLPRQHPIQHLIPG